jgi:hypothetical protein
LETFREVLGGDTSSKPGLVRSSLAGLLQFRFPTAPHRKG